MTKDLLELCAICNTVEGDDPKAHDCKCDECFQEWLDDEPLCDCKEGE
jgi:hypothetical protein